MKIKDRINNLSFTGNFLPNDKPLTREQMLVFWSIAALSIIVKFILIPYNMMDMGDSATRVWNALWWAEKPFFILPESGHPFWFYFMGPVIMITGEIFYTPIISMIVLMTIAGVYVFRITNFLSGFQTALVAYLIFTLNPAVFRLNFEPYAQQTYLAAACIMGFHLIKALVSEKPRKDFIIAGVFSFIALFSRPEAIFVTLPLCFIAFISKKKGRYDFITLSLLFQLLWIVVSYAVYGTFFRTFQSADEYTGAVNIQGFSPGLRLQGLLIPYYYLILGLTFVIFYFFIRGLMHSYRSFPGAVFAALIIPILMPALVNGLAGAKSVIYQTTHYIYLMFFLSPVFSAIGINIYLGKHRSPPVRIFLASAIILSSIPLSYIKELVPYKYNKLFPKVIQFIVTADEPSETRKLIKFIDENIGVYPSLIFDASENASSIFYVPFRTKLAPPEKVMISGYNIPTERSGLDSAVTDFMNRNGSGIVMVRRSPTLMNSIFTEMEAAGNSNKGLFKAQETDKWIIYTYDLKRSVP